MKQIRDPFSALFVVFISVFAILIIIGIIIGLLFLGWKGGWLGVTGIVAAYYSGVINKAVSSER